MTQINISMTGKITFGIPTNKYLVSFARNPQINTQLTLTKSDGSEVKFTPDATGKFELKRLEDGDYNYEIIGITVNNTTLPHKITGNIQVAGRTVTATEGPITGLRPAFLTIDE